MIFLIPFVVFQDKRSIGEKHGLFFPKNTPSDLVDEICGALEVVRVENLGKYLGMPIFHQRVSAGTFNFVVEKVWNKLSGWNAPNLSLAGRITLAKFVVLVIPSYFMSTIELPVSVCGQIEKLARDFICGSSMEKRKPSLLNWMDCCKPLEVGGLSIRSLANQNRVSLLKLGFDIVVSPDKLWLRLL